MSKKIISVVLALVLVLTTFAVSAFAVGGTGYEEDNTYTQTWALSEPVDKGNGIWTVDVTLTANYYVGAISFVVTNTNAENALLTDVAKGAALTYNANIQFNDETGLVAIIPEPSSDAEKGVDLTAGGVIATLTYTLGDGVTAKIAIENAPKTKDAPGGDLIAVRLSDQNLTTATMIYGQTVTSVGEEKNLGAVAADPELVAKEGTTGYVDADRMYVYGVDIGADPLDYFEATNNGYLQMSEGEASVTNGTGATLTLYTEGGEVFAEYTLVIFGDVNGDGGIDSTDTLAVSRHANYVAEFTEDYLIFASDVNADESIDSTDTLAVSRHANYVAELATNVWAA